MQDSVAIVCFGWPAIIASLLVSLAGLLLKRPVLMAVGGVLLLPFSIYLTGYRVPGILLPLLQFGSAYAIRRDKMRLAWLLLAPFIVVTLVLAGVVLTQ
jgi:hypothetical protein